MTGVRGGQTQTTGLPAAARRALQDRERRRDAGRCSGCRRSIRSFPSIRTSASASATRCSACATSSSIRATSAIVYATAWNNAIHRSAPSLEDGDASFKPVFAIVGVRRFRDLAMFDLTVQERPDADLRLQRHGEPATIRRCIGSTTPTCRRRALVTGAGARLVEHLRLDQAARRTTRAQPGLDQPAPLQLAVLLRSRRRRRRRASPTRSSSAASRRRRSASRRSDRRTPAQSFFGVRQRRAESRGTRATSTCASIVFHPRNPTHRVRRIGRRRRPQRRHVHEHREPVPGSCSATPPQCQTMLARVPTRLYFLNKGLQTLQFYNIALDPRAPLRRLIGGLQDNSTIWRDGTGRPAGLEGAVSVRRRHVGVRLPSRRGATCCSPASRATASSRTSATAIPRAGCAPTIRSSRRRARHDHRVHRPAVHHVRRGAVPTRSSPRSSTSGGRRTTAGDRRPSKRTAGFRAATSRARCAATGCRSAWRFRSRSGSTPDFAEPQAGRSDERFLRHRSRRRPHRRGGAHAGRRRHALGGDELRPAVRLEERRRRRRRRRVHRASTRRPCPTASSRASSPIASIRTSRSSPTRASTR